MLSELSASAPILCKARIFLLLFVIVSIEFSIETLYNACDRLSRKIR